MKRWVTSPYDLEEADRLTKTGGLPSAISRLFLARGLDSIDAIYAFCESRLNQLADPFELCGVTVAAERLIKALNNKERVTVFGDYDADGITATALLIKVFAELGLCVAPFIPSRIDEGYGMTSEAIQRCMEYTHPNIIVTVDCGISSVQQVLEAKKLGVDVIITDHHEPSHELPDAIVVINPKLQPQSSFYDLAGVGVAFKLAHGLVKYGRLAGLQGFDSIDLRQFLDLVAIGTVCDLVPLTQENRILVKHGLSCLHKTSNPGLNALADVAGLTIEKLTSHHIGFQLGPRLNAAGRIAEAKLSLDLLLTGDSVFAEQAAHTLNACNTERRQVEESILSQACQQIEMNDGWQNKYFLVASSEAWHPGVIGIVASRIVQKYRRPAAVITIDRDGAGRGSCRSIECFDLLQAIEQLSSYLDRYGGHPMAAGFSIQKHQIESFTKAINDLAVKKLVNQDLREILAIDCVISLSEIDHNLYRWMDQLGPFGMQNKYPVFAAMDPGIRIIDRKAVGQKHTRLSVTDGSHKINGICFNRLPNDIPEGNLSIAFHLQINDYNYAQQVELQIIDMCANEATSSTT